MRLRKVTLTGADETVCPLELAALARKYPFAEFGILFSKSRQGKERRYPGHEWLLKLRHVCDMWEQEHAHLHPSDLSSAQMSMAAHLCGSYVRDLMGEDECFSWMGESFHRPCRWADGSNKDDDYWDDLQFMFQRIQLNWGGAPFDLGISGPLSNADRPYEVILQVRNFDRAAEVRDHPSHVDFSMVYDPSGGTGMRPQGWPKPPEGVKVGYAGGIGPENVRSVIRELEEAVGDAEVWIDMESKLRDENDNFCTDRCEQVLKVAARWAY